MLGKPYFELARGIYGAASYSAVVDLLVEKLPPLIGAEEVVVLTSSPLEGVISVSNHGPLAQLLGENRSEINRLMEKHPMNDKVDFKNPGDLGFAMTDYMSSDEYRNSEFTQGVFGDQARQDVLFGLILNGRRRHTYLNCYIKEGAFDHEQRERFDAILLTVRGVLDRMEANALEAGVRQRVLMMSAQSPFALFTVNLESELCPLNHAAVRLAEKWWEPDEASRALTAERTAQLDVELDDAWENPVNARWKEIKLDLGGGDLPVYVFPKLSGEVILMFSTTDDGGNGEALTILTKRQREIMDWIAEGKTSAEAAIILGISPRTVEKHLEAVFQRLGVENRIAAMRRYLDLKRGF